MGRKIAATVAGARSRQRGCDLYSSGVTVAQLRSGARVRSIQSADQLSRSCAAGRACDLYSSAVTVRAHARARGRARNTVQPLNPPIKSEGAIQLCVLRPPTGLTALIHSRHPSGGARAKSGCALEQARCKPATRGWPPAASPRTACGRATRNEAGVRRRDARGATIRGTEARVGIMSSQASQASQASWGSRHGGAHRVQGRREARRRTGNRNAAKPVGKGQTK